MFGVQVYIWTGQKKNAWFWQRLKHYFVDGNIGHCALKITVPSNPHIDDMVARLCKNTQGKTLIPHFQRQTKVTGKSVDSTGEVRYFPKNVPSWEIYFSWWPQRLGLEHVDRRIENRSIGAVDYEPKWKDYLDVKYLPQLRGPIHSWLGTTLSHLLFGKPKLVAQGIEMIVHPHPRRNQWIDKITTENEKYEKLKQRYHHIRDKLVIAYIDVNRLNAKLSETHHLLEIIVSLVMDDKLQQQWQARKRKKLKQKQKSINALEREAKRLAIMKDKQKEKLVQLENTFFTEVASMGLKPTESFAFPLQGFSYNKNGLNFEQMLNAMHDIVTKGEPFHIFNQNCSSTVYDIMMAGLKGIYGESIPNLPFSVVQTPETISEFLQSLTTVLLSSSFMQAQTSIEPADAILDVQETKSPSVLITSSGKQALKVLPGAGKMKPSVASLKLH